MRLLGPDRNEGAQLRKATFTTLDGLRSIANLNVLRIRVSAIRISAWMRWSRNLYRTRQTSVSRAGSMALSWRVSALAHFAVPKRGRSRCHRMRRQRSFR
jgi:hypothetical protein